MAKVDDLYSDLVLRMEEFKKGLDQARQEARAAGKDMGQSLGDRPKAKISEVGKEAERVSWVVRGYIKDTSRVVTGILISQTFYRLLGAIRSTAAELWQFNQELEVAHVSFKYMIGSMEEATKFMYDLEDFIAQTPFRFEGAVDGARRLMAMGFTAKQVIPVLEILADAAGATGATTAEMNRIVIAMGQIMTHGRLMGRQLLRLAANAIPVYEILEEQLGMTMEQIEETHIPADIAVSAILKGLHERYAGVAREEADLMRGLISTIRDNIMFLGQHVFQGFFTIIRGFFTRIRDTLNELRSIVREGGTGALLERLFSPHVAQGIREIIVYLRELANAIVPLLQMIPRMGAVMFDVYIQLMRFFVPPIAMAIKILADFMAILARSEVAIRTFAGAIVVLGVSKTIALLIDKLKWAVIGLYKALTMYPKTAIITIIAAAFLGLALSIDAVRVRIEALMRQVQAFFGVSTGKILQPTEAATGATGEYAGSLADVIEEFDKMRDSASSALDDAAEGTKKAGKAAKDAADDFKPFLAAFDEVYTIPDELDDADIDDALAGVGDIDLGGLDVDLADLAAGIGDFDFELFDPFAELEIISDVLHDIEEDVIKPWYEHVAEWMLKNPLLGPIMEWLVGTRFGKFLARIGEWAIESLWPWFKHWILEWNFLVVPIEKMIESFRNAWPQVVDWWNNTLVPSFVQGWENMKQWGIEVWETFKTWGIETWESIKTSFSEGWESMKEWAGDIWETFKTWGLETWENIKSSFVDGWEEFKGNAKEAWEGVKKSALAIWEGVTQGAVDAWEGIKGWGIETWETIKSWALETWEDIKTSFRGGWEEIKAWGKGAWSDIKTWAIGTWEDIKTSFREGWNEFKKVAQERWDEIKAWAIERWDEIKTAFRIGWQEFRDTAQERWNEIKGHALERWEELKANFREGWEEFKTVAIQRWEEIKGHAINVWEAIKNWAIGTWEGIRASAIAIWNNIKLWAFGVWNEIKGYAVSTFNEIKSTITGIWDTFKDKAEGAWRDIRNFFRDNPISATIRQVTENVPGLAQGGIVVREQLVRVGEGKHKEAVIPLSTAALRPWAKALISEMGGGMPQTQVAAEPPIQVYAGVVVGDEEGFKALERKLRPIRIRESRRMSEGDI